MDAIQAEKETAMRRYRRLQKIGTLLRCLEAVAGLLLFSWFSARLPAAARLSVDFLRRLAAVLLSPRFIFLLGNAIVLLLFAKSGHLSPSLLLLLLSHHHCFCLLLVILLRGRRRPLRRVPGEPRSPVLLLSSAATGGGGVRGQGGVRRDASIPEEPFTEDGAAPGTPPELRRAGTVVAGRKRDKFPPTTTEASEEEVQAEDAEEFRRAVEAFIAKQTKFHREERMAVASPPFLICSAALPDH
ncbi:unnamed protein product [Musa textilis]